MLSVLCWVISWSLLLTGTAWAQADGASAEAMSAEGEPIAAVSEDTAQTAEEIFNELKQAITTQDFSRLGALLAQLSVHYAFPAAGALLFLFIAYLVASFIARIVSSKISKKVDVTLGRFLAKIVRITIMVLALLGVLGTFGINITSFAAMLAAVGFAIGMALQGTLSNFASGIMLIVFRPFKVEDFIKVSGGEGTVEEIALFTTRINTGDNRHIIIPNNEIFGSTIVNYSRNDLRRVDVGIGTAYEADLLQTRQELVNAISQIPGSLQEPEPQVLLSELGGSSIDWQLRVWCRKEAYWAVREAVMEQAKLTLDRAGIGIPYPQMDVHVDGQVSSKSV